MELSPRLETYNLRLFENSAARHSLCSAAERIERRPFSRAFHPAYFSARWNPGLAFDVHAGWIGTLPFSWGGVSQFPWQYYFVSTGLFSRLPIFAACSEMGFILCAFSAANGMAAMAGLAAGRTRPDAAEAGRSGYSTTCHPAFEGHGSLPVPIPGAKGCLWFERIGGGVALVRFDQPSTGILVHRSPHPQEHGFSRDASRRTIFRGAACACGRAFPLSAATSVPFAGEGFTPQFSGGTTPAPRERPTDFVPPND